MTLSQEDSEALSRTIAHQERVISSLRERLQEQKNPEVILRSLRGCGFSIVLTSDVAKESRIRHANHVLGPELTNVLEDVYSDLEHPGISQSAKRQVLQAFQKNYGWIRGDEAPLGAKNKRNDTIQQGYKNMNVSEMKSIYTAFMVPAIIVLVVMLGSAALKYGMVGLEATFFALLCGAIGGKVAWAVWIAKKPSVSAVSTKGAV